MRRRAFIAGLGSTAAWPLAAWAQQPAMPVVGFMHPGSSDATAHLAAAFRQGLIEAGYSEGRNVAIEYRYANNAFDRLPELASDLVRRRVAVIFANGPAVVAAKAATATIPIVFAWGNDPVELGLVASLNRPGGNITGFTGMSLELIGKQLGLLHEMVPQAMRFAVLVNPTSPTTESTVSDMKAAASAMGLQVEVLTATTSSNIDAAFATLVQKRTEGLLVGSDALFIGRRVQLATLAVKYNVPAIFPFREDADAGGLMSYGSSITDAHRQAGIYCARILKGEKPSDLPVVRPTRFEFVINLQTAKTLGLTVPPGLLAITDEVIE